MAYMHLKAYHIMHEHIKIRTEGGHSVMVIFSSPKSAAKQTSFSKKKLLGLGQVF